MKILLVEEDEELISILTKSLAEHHYIVDVVKDGEMGWSYGSTFEYDLVILDILLSKLDGISLCDRFRTEGYEMPIILLTNETKSNLKITGLDVGADDCIVKPIDVPELIARIRALLRRSNASSFPLLVWGDLLLNPSTCEVFYNRQLLTLTNKEYEILELLLRDSQHLLSADELLERLWSSDDYPSEATLRSHIRRLRHKLAAAGAPSDFIATVHGRGYYLKAPDFVKPLSDKFVDSYLISPSSATSQFHQRQSPSQSVTLIENNAVEALASISSSFMINQFQMGVKVMVVDDDTEHLRSLPDLLAPWEFKVTTLDNSQEFWTVLESVLPDVLLLEVNIPRINGLELCQKLRNNPKWQGLPVLFLSTITDVSTQHLAFSVGADDYLCKPIEAIDLANRIHNRLQRIRAYTKSDL